MCLTLFGAAQKVTLSGYLKDKESGEDLIGATVFVQELKVGAAANIYGFYSLTVPKGEYTFEFSFIGYETITQTMNLQENTKLNLELGISSQTLQEVVVEGEAKNRNVEAVEMSTIKVKMETIKKIPALMGEVDVLRAIQLLPGVSNSGEASTGFFVRGGASDQNMILLDEAPVYNASHLLGFFSVFNQDAIKDAQLYKGGIPAEFGGRLSSVLDVKMKEGNLKKFKVAGGIGLISSRLTVEGPIAKNRASFIISGRRSYADIFLPLSNQQGVRESKLYFYDLNGKVNWKINEKNRVFVSAYTGRDVLGVGELFRLGWGNRTFTSRWNHVFTEKLFSNATVIYSNYDYLLGIPTGTSAFDWTSKIENWSGKYDFNWYANPNNTVKFGIQSIFHTFSPATFTPGDENETFTELKLFDRYALENAAYISNEQKLGRWRLKYGVRASSFSNVGIDTLFTYNDNFDTTGYQAYGRGDLYNTYFGIEPRLAVKFTLDDKSSLKASYNRTFQYLHLASNSTAAAPLDVWMPSSPNIKPQIADQVAIGYFRNLKNDMFETSVEVYYKTMQNQIDFRDNARLLFNPLLDGEVRAGKAWSYGLELFIRKQTGKMTGWISYTLSRTRREIPLINNGNPYPANYDKPHNLAIVFSYDFTEQLNLSANWVYSTGTPLTAPVGRYEYQGVIVPAYSERNGRRIPDYHRMDLSINWDFKMKPGAKWTHGLNLSIFNLYSRKNPFAINFVQNSDNTAVPDEIREQWIAFIPQLDQVIDGYTDPNITTARLTYLFPIIPSLTYNFKF